jgi:hypothetical protein
MQTNYFQIKTKQPAYFSFAFPHFNNLGCKPFVFKTNQSMLAFFKNMKPAPIAFTFSSWKKTNFV